MKKTIPTFTDTLARINEAEIARVRQSEKALKSAENMAAPIGWMLENLFGDIFKPKEEKEVSSENVPEM